MSSVSRLSGFSGLGTGVSGPARGRAPTAGFGIVETAGWAAGRPVATASLAASSVADAAGIAATSAGLLALQDEPEGLDAQARRRGRALLGGLTRLQDALLGDGADWAGTLASLRAELIAMPETADPALRAVLAEIALRVDVELARWDDG